jgi:hypothetical protein
MSAFAVRAVAMHTQWQSPSGFFETTGRWFERLGDSEGFIIVGAAFIIAAIVCREVGEYRRNTAREDRRSLKSSAMNAKPSRGWEV